MESRIRRNFTIPSRLESTAQFRLELEQLLLERLNQELVSELVLATMEVLHNCVLHAYYSEPSYFMHLSLLVGASEVEVQITDTGKSLSPEILESASMEKLQAIASNQGTLPERGMGLAIIKTIFNEVTYSSNSSVNTMTLRRTGIS